MRIASLYLFILFLVTLPLPLSAQDDQIGGVPQKVNIELEKDQVLPGEIIKVTLSGLVDIKGISPDHRQRIVVDVLHGEIIEGIEIATEDPVPGKAFPVGYGPLHLHYRAPSSCAGADVITVYNSRDVITEEAKPLAETPFGNNIGMKELKILCSDYVDIKGTYYHHWESCGATGTTDIKATVRAYVKPFSTGSRYASPNLLQVTSVKLMSISGYDEYKSGDTTEKLIVSSATPGPMGTMVQLRREAKSGRILSASIPTIHVMLNWMGEAGFVPPQSIELGPVSEQKDKSKKDLEKDAAKVEREMENPRSSRERKEEAFNVMQKMFNHPDHLVKSGDGKTSLSGGGDFEEPYGYGTLKKTYRWELIFIVNR